ncbi:hypothetical protein [Streptomyces anandii]|uniref:hypothetical protein n=1 Tax=Streptomyces anandii TaxID=285454 RepID=UPI00167A4D73|nr:hypothetical protein [Streptomyces anandii]GGY10453.1 hypothetical protein GCM10010510_65460 [Streptomyces anandii JCM 4720]
MDGTTAIRVGLRHRRTSLTDKTRLKDSASRRKTFAAALQQFEEQMNAAGGRIVKSGSGPGLEKWPSRVAAARRSGRIPETKELYGNWCRDGYEIKLVDIPAWRLTVLDPVPVPSRLTRPHTVIRAMQNERQPLGLTTSLER